MIRYFILISVSLLVSCGKEKVNLGIDFDKLIGKWENIEGDDRIHISVQENGKIKVSKSTERGNRYKINLLEKNPNGENVNGYIWDKFECYEMDKNNNIIIGLTFIINPTSDTVFFYDGGTPINNFTTGGGDNAYLYKRIE